MKPTTFELHADHSGRPRVLANLIGFLNRLPDSKGWQVSIEPIKRKRTGQQNRALWAVAEATLAEFAGYQGTAEREALHRDLCAQFFGTRTDALGLVHPKRTTTTNERGERDVIDTQTANEFFAFIQRIGAEHGCFIPDPDPFWREGKR